MGVNFVWNAEESRTPSVGERRLAVGVAGRGRDFGRRVRAGLRKLVAVAGGQSGDWPSGCRPARIRSHAAAAPWTLQLCSDPDGGAGGGDAGNPRFADRGQLRDCGSERTSICPSGSAALSGPSSIIGPEFRHGFPRRALPWRGPPRSPDGLPHLGPDPLVRQPRGRHGSRHDGTEPGAGERTDRRGAGFRANSPRNRFPCWTLIGTPEGKDRDAQSRCAVEPGFLARPSQSSRSSVSSSPETLTFSSV